MTQGGSGRLSADRGDSGWLGVARGRRLPISSGPRRERITGAAVLLSDWCGGIPTGAWRENRR